MAELLQFKILLVGDSGVGKTSLMQRFTQNKFSYETRSTIGVEYAKKIVDLDDTKIQAQLWDTAGQERFRAMAPQYYKGAAGALIVFDITKKQSFENIEEVWLKEISNYGKDNIQVLIIGNKSDLQDQRAVSEDFIKQYCEDNGFGYLETSAKENLNVEQCFKAILQGIYDPIKEKIKQEENSRIKFEDLVQNSNINNENNTVITLDQNNTKKKPEKKKKCDC